MCRYTETRNALVTALNLMVEQEDTALVILIARSLHQAEVEIERDRTLTLAAIVARNAATS